MSRFLTLLALSVALPSLAQSPALPKPLKLVMPQGTGAITFQIAGDWHPERIDILDNGTRPTIQLTNEKSKLDLSYILFPNPTQNPTAEGCRNSVITSVIDNLNHDIKIQNKQQTTRKLKDGRSLAVASYLIAFAGAIPLEQQNVFGFSGDAHTCAEIHLSAVKYTAAKQPLFDEALDAFTYDPAYAPTSLDYAALGAIFYSAAQNYAASAIYYQRALDTASALANNPAGDDPLAYTRYLTDQLSMSYGISGDIKKSRAVNEAAIARDPLYPLYYYNLACADAEEGNAGGARTHLEQAFARRANTLKGETMPDPAKDDSILKLKSDKDFWAFVESLSEPESTGPAKN